LAYLLGYNDYVNITRQYLKNYNMLFITRENLMRMVKDLQDEMIPSAPVARYGNMPSGGTGELNSVESMADGNMMRDKRIRQMEQDIEHINRLFEMLSRSIGALDQAEQEILHDAYIDGKSWGEIGRDRYITEKWARQRAGKAIRKVAMMMFGMDAVPLNEESFCFAV